MKRDIRTEIFEFKLLGKIDVRHIDRVKQFCYLDSQITNDNKSTEDVKGRIVLAKSAFQRKQNLLVNQNLSITTRKRFLKTFV